MRSDSDNFDRLDADVLLYDFSDDALEAAAGVDRGAAQMSFAGGDCTTVPACFKAPEMTKDSN